MSQLHMHAPLGLASRVWAFIEEPKAVTIVQAIMVYLAAVGGGILTLIWPPTTTSIILGDNLVTWIAGLLIFGGAVGTVTSIIGWWWIERPLAIGFLTVAVTLYLWSVIEAQWVSDSGARWLQMTCVFIALGGLATRWIRIRKANYDPVN